MSDQPSNPSQVNSRQAFQAALDLHQAGKLAEAERDYRQILSADETFAPAWHFLGILLMQSNQLPQAIEHIQHAIKLGLNGPDVQNNLGEALRAANRFDEAIQAYQQAIRMDENSAVAHANLGVAFNESGRFAEAIPHLQKSLSLRPHHAQTLYQYGLSQRKVGHREVAIEMWERSLRQSPDYLPALNDLGEALHRSNRFDRALPILRRLVERYPQFATGHANFARTLASTGAVEQAIEHARKAIELEPKAAAHQIALGVVLTHADRFEEAIEAARKAIELDPNSPVAYANLGGALAHLNRAAESVESFERAVALKPNDSEMGGSLAGAYMINGQPQKALDAVDQAMARNPMMPILHRHRAVALLAVGRFAEGWEEHEWRWRVDAPMHNPRRDFDRPMWDGSDPTGRKILVHPEQGYGDVIQFARYAPMLAAAGAEVILEVPAALRDLLASLRCKATIVPNSVKLPDFDLHVPLMSLPRIYKTTADTIPSDVPYLFPAAARLKQFRPLIINHAAGRLKVGLVWAGNVIPDHRRTVPFNELFESLAGLPDVAWFSLQTGEDRSNLKTAPAGTNVLDMAPHLKDFADTAAVMSMLDLVITIDTASAHLAGAIGAKTWTMLTAAPDWRWGWESDSTPWYPTMRLFRQKRLGDWSPVVEDVRRELSMMAKS